MKKKYKVLILITAFNFLLVSILEKVDFAVHSWLGNAIGILLFMLPLEMLLFLLAKDNTLKPKIQTGCCIAFWFILICYLLGGIATLISH